jgi:hypothetical protein
MEESFWIWYDQQSFNLVNSWMQARKEITLKSVPEKLVIGVTADSRYRLYINGKYVYQGPARGFQEDWGIDYLDIHPYLKKGTNVIAALVHNLGMGNFQYIHRGSAGLYLYSDELPEINTNKTWKVRPAPAYLRHQTRVSLQLGFQEIYNARQEDGDWLAADYDDSKWLMPLGRRLGSMPWRLGTARGVQTKQIKPETPLMKMKLHLPQNLVSESVFKTKSNIRNAQDIVTVYCEEKREWKLTGEKCDSTLSSTSLDIQHGHKEKYSKAICLDMGREVVGSIWLKIEGAKGTEIIDTLVCEGIEKGVPVIKKPSEEWCRMAFGNRLFCKKGTTEHEQFEIWGFRYLILVVRDFLTPLHISLKVNGSYYPLDIKGQFTSADPILNKIYRASVQTQECCMLDSYVDCPWREQAQWWGDARIQGANTFYLSADTRLFEKGLKQIGMQQIDNGLTYGLAPSIAHECILPDYTLVWIDTFWDLYWQTGTTDKYKSIGRERCHKALEYYQKIIDDNHTQRKPALLHQDKTWWLFLDWAPLFKEGYPTLYNLLYLLTLKKVVQLESNLKEKKNLAQEYQKRADKLEKEIIKKLFNKKEHSLYAGLDWKGQIVSDDNPHMYALAILSGLCPQYHDEFARRYLLPLVQGDRTQPVIPSPYFMFYIFEALKQCGYGKEVVDCIRRWWGEFIKKGFTTTPEVWDPVIGSHSLCHAWSAHPIVHFSNVLLGIWQTQPGWKEIKYQPDFSSVRFAKGKIATPLGEITSSWEKKGNRVYIKLLLPDGMAAEMVEPDGATRRIIKSWEGYWNLEK